MSFNHEECLVYYNTLHNFSNNECLVADLAINLLSKSNQKPSLSQDIPFSNQSKGMSMLNYDAVKTVRAQPALVAALVAEEIKELPESTKLTAVYFDVNEKPVFKDQWIGCFKNADVFEDDKETIISNMQLRYVDDERASIWNSGNMSCKRLKAKKNCHELLANMVSNCAHILYCSYAYFGRDEIYLYSPRVDFNAHRYFNDNRTLTVRRQQSLLMFFDVLRGLYYMNEKLNLAHCDIKLANILYDTKGDHLFKICDLGSALPLHKKGIFMGTLPHVAPEILDVYCNSPNTFDATMVIPTEKVDVWSLGLIMHLLNNQDDYKPILDNPSLKEKKLYDKLKTQHRKTIELTAQAKGPYDVFHYISKLCLTEAHERPVPETLLRLFGCFNNFISTL